MRVVRSLVIETDRREILVGELITVRVRDNRSQPIENVIVECGSQQARTDVTGRCRFTIDAPGFWKVYARKEPTERVSYRAATAQVRVVTSRRSPWVLGRVNP